MYNNIWPICRKRVAVYDRKLTDIEFCRALKEPCLLNEECIENFPSDLFLHHVPNDEYKAIDYKKFLNICGNISLSFGIEG